MDAKQIRDFENECEIMRCPFPSLLTLTHRTARTHARIIARTRTSWGSLLVSSRRQQGAVALHSVLLRELRGATGVHRGRVLHAGIALRGHVRGDLQPHLGAITSGTLFAFTPSTSPPLLSSSSFPPCARSSGRRSWPWPSTTCTSAQLHPPPLVLQFTACAPRLACLTTTRIELSARACTCRFDPPVFHRDLKSPNLLVHRWPTPL